MGEQIEESPPRHRSLGRPTLASGFSSQTSTLDLKKRLGCENHKPGWTQGKRFGCFGSARDPGRSWEVPRLVGSKALVRKHTLMIRVAPYSHSHNLLMCDPFSDQPFWTSFAPEAQAVILSRICCSEAIQLQQTGCDTCNVLDLMGVLSTCTIYYPNPLPQEGNFDPHTDQPIRL